MQKVALVVGGVLLVIVGLLSCSGSGKSIFGAKGRTGTSVRTPG